MAQKQDTDNAAELARLKVAVARLRQLLNLVPAHFYVVDGNGNMLEANQHVSDFYGRPLDQIVGRNIREFVPPQNVDSFQQLIQAAIERGSPRPWTDTVLTPDGRPRKVEGHDIPFVDAETGESRVLGFAVDVTEQLEGLRRKRDLEIARDIQRSLLPQTAPSLEGFEVAGWSEAADEAGGDYYDWAPLPGGRFVVTIADVSGHGIGPAIVTAVCRAYARALMSDQERLEDIVQRLNRLLHEDLQTGRFVTFAAAAIEPARSRIELFSAGHGPILIYRAAGDCVENVEAQGFPLAVVPTAEFDAPVAIDMNPGDVLLLFSDGLWEWCNPDGEPYGIDRLSNSIRQTCAGTTSAEDVIQGLRSELQRFVADAPQPDDATVIVIRRTSD